MTAFRVLLVAMFVIVAVYTAIVIAAHGMNLFAVFFADIARMGWAGQFNVDFMCFLVFSGLWVAWRHEFSPAGLGLGVVAFFGGAPFLSVYLFIASFAANGDVKELLLGKGRAAA